MSDPSMSKVVRRARKALSASPIYDLRELQVEEVGEALVLSGDVESWHHKQMAQELVRSVPGAQNVINIVEVQETAVTEGEVSIVF